MLTEQQNPRTRNIDTLSTAEVVAAINREDQQVALAVQAALPGITEAVEAIVERLAGGGRLIYVGAGTSGRLGVLDAVECVPTFGTSPDDVIALIAGGTPALTQPMEGAEDNAEAGKTDLAAINLSAQDCVVGIAASGRTPYVLGALAYASEIGAATVGISCNVPAPVLDAAQIAIGVPVGAEVVAGSTRMKAGTAQKLVLNMLSTASMIRLGKVYDNLMVDVQVTNAKLAHRAQQIVAMLAGVDATTAAALLQSAQNNVKAAIVMQRQGVDYENALPLLANAGGNLRRIIG